jgi:hypothetical protein
MTGFVLPTAGQPGWDVTLNNALLYLDAQTGQINGVSVTNAPAVGQVLAATGTATAAWTTGTPGSLVAANNLSDLTNVSTARTNLGLGTAATASASAFAPARTDQFNVQSYGAVGDGQIIGTASMTSGQNVINFTGGSFTVADQGKSFMLHKAGTTAQYVLTGTITTVNSANQIVVSATASTTVSNVNFFWGTDDTLAIQTAINNAVSYAASHGAAEVFTPAPSKLFYVIAGPLNTSHNGNAQLYLPPVVTTGNKSNITFRGIGNGALLEHWQQTIPQFSGSTWVSFGSFASVAAQNTAINNNGNACVIGGPSQPGGYGVSPGVFSNMGVTFTNMSILTAYTAYGIGYSAGDMSGMSNCTLIDFGYGTTGTVPSNELNVGGLLANGVVIGWLMPANGNNDLCEVRNLTCHGGYTFGFLATEHTVIDSARILYCWSGYCPTGAYFGGVGATHAFYAAQLSIEACTNVMNVFGAGSAGIGPFIDIVQLDTEAGAPTFVDRQSGAALQSCLGTIKLTGLYTVANVTTSPTGLKIINGQSAYPIITKTANYTVSVVDDTILVDATAGPVTITLIPAAWTPNTYTVKKIDSTANAVTVAAHAGDTIDGAATVSLTTQYQHVKVVPGGGNTTKWFTV